MEAANTVVAAFGEYHTSRLTGVSLQQLRHWDRSGFYRPSFANENRRAPFSRVYSFRDIVALRVLNSLRNQFGVSLQHLREVSDKLAHLADDRWTKTRLYVLKKKVVWQEPDSDIHKEVVSEQYVVPVVLLTVIADTKNDIAKLNARDGSDVGRIEKNRFVSHNASVVAGTRIQVAAIKRFANAGYSNAQIISEYPDLTESDIEAALNHGSRRAA